MNNNKTNYFLIVLGGAVAIYAKAENAQNVALLILGIIILMFGIYRIARAIPSKFENEDEDKPDE